MRVWHQNMKTAFADATGKQIQLNKNIFKFPFKKKKSFISLQHECPTYFYGTLQMQSKRSICFVELLTQSLASILRKWQVEREDRWGHRGLLLGGVTTKPAATGLIWCLVSVPLAHIPPTQVQVQGCQVKHEGRILFFPVMPSQKQNTWSPKRVEGATEEEGAGIIRWATPPLDLSLFYLAHISFHFMPSLPPTSHSLVVLLSGSQLSDWEMAGETEVFCLGRWSREDWGLRTQTHKWSVFPSAPVKLGTCCNT